MLVHSATLQCWCTVLLRSAGAQCYSAVLVHSATPQCWCTVLLGTATHIIFRFESVNTGGDIYSLYYISIMLFIHMCCVTKLRLKQWIPVLVTFHYWRRGLCINIFSSFILYCVSIFIILYIFSPIQCVRLRIVIPTMRYASRARRTRYSSAGYAFRAADAIVLSLKVALRTIFFSCIFICLHCIVRRKKVTD